MALRVFVHQNKNPGIMSIFDPIRERPGEGAEENGRIEQLECGWHVTKVRLPLRHSNLDRCSLTQFTLQAKFPVVLFAHHFDIK